MRDSYCDVNFDSSYISRLGTFRWQHNSGIVDCGLCIRLQGNPGKDPRTTCCNKDLTTLHWCGVGEGTDSGTIDPASLLLWLPTSLLLKLTLCVPHAWTARYKFSPDPTQVWNCARKMHLLLSENKPYSLNSTYNFCALKNLQFKFQGKNLNLNRDSNWNGNFDSIIGKSTRLVIWRSEVRIPVKDKIFLLKSVSLYHLFVQTNFCKMENTFLNNCMIY